MDNGLITTIIKKFLDGDCSDEEFAYLLYWYESFDENPDIQLDEQEKDQLGSKIIDRIRQRMPELGELQGRTRRRKARVVGMKRGVWLKYAAVAAVLIVLAWGTYTRFTPPSSAVLTGPQNDLITLTNQSDRNHLVLLPDSSKVWLSPQSKLEYPETFQGRERPVHLEGEAFFEIHQQPAQPFIVTSGDLVTRVLGTSFLLRAYAGAPAEVTVVTGKVAVSRADDPGGKRVTLISSEKAVMNVDGALVKEAKPDNSVLKRWQQVDLSFENTPFSQVIEALDRKFDIRIHCVDSVIYHYKLNADFSHQKLTDILEMLEKSLNIHYGLTNDSIINFYANGADWENRK